MTLCCECGAQIGPDENFCGSCGARQKRDDSGLSAAGAALADTQQGGVSHDPEKLAEGNSTLAPPKKESAPVAPRTGQLADSAEFSSNTARADGVPERRSKPKALAAGKVLNNRYEVVRRIGGGGMGAVYLAKDGNLGDAPRAVKEMIESHLDDTQHEKAIADFKRESLLLTELEHPSIPTVYDYFYDDASERFYLVMKFIPGSDLASRLRASPGGRIDELTVTEWGIQVADVLHYLHTRPQAIIYRDLKPANLMLDSNVNRIMLIDFGIARWVNKKEKGVTAVGTMGYAPPELFSGQADARVDIYSLGATMFHLLTGSDPQDNPLLIFDFTRTRARARLTRHSRVKLNVSWCGRLNTNQSIAFSQAQRCATRWLRISKNCEPGRLVTGPRRISWVARPWPWPWFSVDFAAGESRPMIFFVRTADRGSHWPELIPALAWCGPRQS